MTSPKTFQQAFGRENFAFNHFYVDKRHIAYITDGWYPRRAKGVDPSLPAWGTGEWDWQGFDPATFASDGCPTRSCRSRSTPSAATSRTGTTSRRRAGARPTTTSRSARQQRVQRLQKRVRAGIKGRRKMTLTGLTKAMEDAATVDLRGQVSFPLLRKVIGKRSPTKVRGPLRLLASWAKAGGHRRDLDGDGVYEHCAAVALMDAWWQRLMPGVFEPALGRHARRAHQGHQPVRADAGRPGQLVLRRLARLPGQGPPAAARPAREAPAVAALLRRRQAARLPPHARRHAGRGRRAVRSAYGTDLAGVRVKATRVRGPAGLRPDLLHHRGRGGDAADPVAGPADVPAGRGAALATWRAGDRGERLGLRVDVRRLSRMPGDVEQAGDTAVGQHRDGEPAAADAQLRARAHQRA